MTTPSHSTSLGDGCCRHGAHNHVGHNYVGDKYTGRTYVGHHDMGHNYVGHAYVGHSYVGHNGIGHTYIDYGLWLPFDEPLGLLLPWRHGAHIYNAAVDVCKHHLIPASVTHVCALSGRTCIFFFTTLSFRRVRARAGILHSLTACRHTFPFACAYTCLLRASVHAPVHMSMPLVHKQARARRAAARGRPSADPFFPQNIWLWHM